MANNTIGIDIGGTNIKAAWVEDNRITSQIIEQNTPQNISDFRNILWDVLKTLNINDHTRLGFSIPGVVDYNEQKVLLCPNLDFLNNLGAKDILERDNSMVGNDADMALLGEVSSGGLWDQNVALVALGTGVGSSYFINNTSPWQNNLLSEIGHIKVASNGRQCSCGGKDCLETYFSGWALMNEAKKSNLTVNNVYDMFNLIQNSNQIAIDILNNSIIYLGIAISDLMNLTGINQIILSGKISHSFDYFKESLMNAISSGLHPKAKDNFSVRKSELINQGSIIGSVARFD